MNNGPNRVQYGKPFLAVTESIALLKARGMQITDECYAKRCLENIGYQRLDRYWCLFYAGDDRFSHSVTFNHIMSLYEFDRKLKLLVLDSLEKIEISVRTQVAIVMGKKSPNAHLEKKLLDTNKYNIDKKYEKWLEKYNVKIKDERSDIVAHFTQKENYDINSMPLWLAIELWDYGLLVKFLELIKFTDKVTLVNYYKQEHLVSWMKSLRAIRNICAHHDKLFDKNLHIKPILPKANPFNNIKNNNIYCILVIIKYLLEIIDPHYQWTEKIKAILLQFPQMPTNLVKKVGPHLMGIPEGHNNIFR